MPIAAQNPSASDATAALVARARRGDQDAWSVLVDRYRPLLRAVARGFHLSRADADDAIQVTWLRCVQHLDRIHDPARLGAWLATTCRRECLRVLRQSARCTPADGEELEAPVPWPARDRAEADPANAAVSDEERSTVRAAIADLPRRQRDVLLGLLEVSEDPQRGYADVAARLRVPTGSLGPTRQRALARLGRDPRVAGLA
jgi:RNA polymerase sigma factor (sigma-70 family)